MSVEVNAEGVIIALETIAEAHDIDPYELGSALAESLRDAVMRHADSESAYVSLDLETGGIHLEAHFADGSAEAVSLADLGRRGASTIKEAFDRAVEQVMLARLREMLASQTGRLVRGEITQMAPGTAIISLPDGLEAELRTEHAGGLRFRRGMTVTAELTGHIYSTGGTPRAQLSRLSEEFITALLTEAVPSVADGDVVVTSIARDPGFRTKVLLSSTTGRDPVAPVIGSRGATIRRVVDEIYPERIDVLAVADPEEMVAAALSPARVYRVEMVSPDHARVWVSEEERGKAFGTAGRNVRLASQLLDIQIEIVSPGSEVSATGDADDETPEVIAEAA